MIYSLSFKNINDILKEHDLLLETNADAFEETEIIRKITYDSRTSDPDSLFICKGVSFKEEYFYQAKTNGFAAYVSEHIYDRSVTFFHVSDVKKALSVLSIAFFKRPSQAFKLTGITGTAGKTTTTYMLHSILNEAAGKTTGIISTNETYCGGVRKEAENTTPESLKLQELFAEAKENEIPYVTMEVSSQAYSVDRVYDQIFDIGVFMNIDMDHIGGPEHPSYEHYRDCKMQLIKNSRTMLVYARTKEMQLIIDTAKESDCKLVIFDVFDETSDGTCDTKTLFEASPDPEKIKNELGRDIAYYYIDNVRREEKGGYVFSFNKSSDGKDISTEEYAIDLTGHFNLVNAAAAIASAYELDIASDHIRKGISHVFVPGRMNIYKKDNTTIIVDYAHNRLTLLEFLKSCVSDYPGHKFSVVIGAAGKNHLRRKDIGGLCSEYADYIYLTEEDPDFEDPREICEDIATYIPEGSAGYEIEPDRTKAIEKALKDNINDTGATVVAILGKGMEAFSKFKGKHIPYESDSGVVERVLDI